MGTIFVILAIFSFLFSSPTFCDNNSPMIGIMTKPLIEEYPDIETSYTEVIEAKYVHFIEGGGGRVVPLSYKWDQAKLREIMQKLNGVLFTGGATDLVSFDVQGKPTDLTEYSKGGRRVLDIAIEMNQKGLYFPVWGTCLGYELLLILESGNIDLLGHCGNCSNYNAYLKYNEAEVNKARLYKQGFTAYQRALMGKENITYNNHVWMVDNDTFYANPPLVEKYRILSYSQWWNQTSLYISAVEHKQYPFFGIQFHPEKWNYEVNPKQNVLRYRDVITLGHAFSNFFVDQCRKNDNKFASYEEELKHLVQNEKNYYHPEYGYLYFLGKKTAEMKTY